MIRTRPTSAAIPTQPYALRLEDLPDADVQERQLAEYIDLPVIITVGVPTGIAIPIDGVLRSVQVDRKRSRSGDPFEYNIIRLQIDDYQHGVTLVSSNRPFSARIETLSAIGIFLNIRFKPTP